MSDESLSGLETAVEAFLAKEQDLTPVSIRAWIDQFRAMPRFAVSDEKAEWLARRLEARHDVTMSLGSILMERDYKPWLDAAKSSIQFQYWDRYRKLLEQKHLSQQVINTLSAETDRILGLLENPEKAGPWSRRGMVVGHVQSGKTANYIGLLSKAADAGYRLIVVIAGVHNNLRNQTQKRIDEGFVGRDSARLLAKREERYVGVGYIDATRRPVTFTNSVRDFSKAMATGVGVPLQNLNEPAVFVIKKNPSTLTNLVEWLREHNSSRSGRTVDLPVLVIDDEADNASINVSYDKGEVSRINAQLRELLQIFSRSCYVGYTATPFANIFIDPDTDDEMLGADLFPRHFIVSLDPPSNYFGPTRVFGDSAGNVVRHIDDNEGHLPLRHAIDLGISSLPPSLYRAIRAFVVARGIRLCRGQRNSHSSMLVNVSRFTRVQGQVRALIQEVLQGIQASVRINGGLAVAQALQDPEIAGLHSVWREEFSSAGPAWATVQSALLEAAAPVRVVEVNSQSHGTLNYEEYKDTGLNVIAVGGFALSRGLTLEGLMVSYFLRNSMMYDTLMQMGRWFGYRMDYEDLCRVWLPEEAEGWYVHVADSIEMLREEFRRMAAAGATPEEFGLKVRAHPDTLIVTARNKMGSSENVVVSIGLDNQFVETATLRNDRASLATNREVARVFVDKLARIGKTIRDSEQVAGGRLLRAVPVVPVREFLSAFLNHPASLLSDPAPVVRYIRRREGAECAEWDVLIAGVNSSASDQLSGESLGIDITCQRRTAGRATDAMTLRVSNKQRVASRGVEKSGVEPGAIMAAEQRYVDNQARDASTSRNFPDRIYRAYRQRPLFILHLLEMRDGNGQRLYEEPVVAWSISFPKTALLEERVEYVVTTTWLRENLRDDTDDEDMDSE